MAENEEVVEIELTGTQKSAILMMLLGEDEASEVLKHLTPKGAPLRGKNRSVAPKNNAP